MDYEDAYKIIIAVNGNCSHVTFNGENTNYIGYRGQQSALYASKIFNRYNFVVLIQYTCISNYQKLDHYFSWNEESSSWILLYISCQQLSEDVIISRVLPDQLCQDNVVRSFRFESFYEDCWLFYPIRLCRYRHRLDRVTC